MFSFCFIFWYIWFCLLAGVWVERLLLLELRLILLLKVFMLDVEACSVFCEDPALILDFRLGWLVGLPSSFFWSLPAYLPSIFY